MDVHFIFQILLLSAMVVHMLAIIGERDVQRHRSHVFGFIAACGIFLAVTYLL